MADSSIAVINLGSQRVSAAVFAKSKSGELVLKALESVEMHGDPSVETTRLPQLRVALVELTQKLKLKGKTVRYAIAGHVVFTRFVKLPPFDQDKADQMVEFEARQNVPFPINEVIWDYAFIGDEGGGEREVALVAIKADALNDVNDQLESAGLKVSGVELAPLAVYNAFRYTYPEVNESSLIIDLGAKSTNLVFVEGSRVFTRNILIGGSTLTNAIVKELGMSYGDAENEKRQRGYVAPGGAYEPHEDETVEAISKIMRNSMTRLHGEIVRTVNYYRTQQGGSPPRRFFICGGGAGAALMAEFFQEKFNLPVEILNPLRGIQSEVRDTDEHGSALMELTGLALRQSGAAPLEVELVPDTVSTARESAKRAPFLVMAMLCIFALLGAAILYYKRANTVVGDSLAKNQSELQQLQAHDRSIKNLDKELAAQVAKSSQIEQAVNDRDYWKQLLSTLNNQFEDDFIWLTDVEILKNGSSLVAPTVAGVGSAPAPAPAPTTPPVPAGGPGAAPAVEASPYSLRVSGLYRKNDSGQEVVYKYYNKLKQDAAVFATAPPEDKPDVDTGIDEERYAYRFRFRLPLVNGMKFEK